MKKLLSSLLVLLSCTGTAVASPVTLRILYLNDFHGQANPVSQAGSPAQIGGAARLARQIELLRREHPGLLLATGDMLQGNSWADRSQGRSVIQLMNLIGFDAMALGINDLSLGRQVLQKRIAGAAFPVVAANMSGLAGTQPRVYFNRAGLRVAVIGLMGESASRLPAGAVAELSFGSALEAAQDQISEAELTADLVILLTHQGYKRDLALAQELCGGASPSLIPVLIVGGDSHTRLEQPAQNGNCTVVQAGKNGEALGIVELTINDGKQVSVTGRLQEITPALGHGNPKVAALVRHYNRSKTAAPSAKPPQHYPHRNP